MANIVLTKESNENEIKAYFNAVLKLTESREEFPVNFDEVWMLVYEDKRSAIYELKDKFIKDVDYQTVRRKVQASNVAGYVWADDYFLTVPCMEFFIARKVRPVFEVYRQVFHTAAQNVAAIAATQPAPKLSEKMQVATWLIKTLNLNDASKLQLAKAIADPIGLPTPDYTPGKGILKSATELLKANGIANMTAKDFNLRALLKGYLCEQTRKNSKGEYKTFKSVTEKGKAYGENQVSPKNPRETQPLWYADRFGELLEKLGITGASPAEGKEE